MLRQSVTTVLRYDTNAFIRPEGQSQTGDLVLLIMPQFNVDTERRGFELTAFYSPTASVYFNNPGLNSITHYGSVGIDTELTRKWSFNASDVLTYSNDTLGPHHVGIQTVRSNVWTNTVNLATAYALTDKLSGSVSFSDSIFRSDTPTSVKSRTDSASVGLGYSVTANTALNASYGYSNFSFDTAGGRNDIESHSAMVGFSHKFPYSLDVALAGGANYSPSLGDEYDWLASATVTKSFQNLALSLEYSRGITNTSGLTDQLNINDRISTVATYAIGQAVDLTVFGDYSRSRSKPIDIVSIDSYSAGISSQWRVYQWLSVEGGYSHFKQISDGLIGDDFKRDHFFLSLTLTTYEGKI